MAFVSGVRSWGRRLRGVYFGWWVVSAGVALQALQVGLFEQAYGVYLPVLQSEFGWSTTVLAAAYSGLQLVRGMIGPLQGWLLMRYDPRFVMLAGIVLMSGGFVLFSRMTSLTGFFVAFGVLAVGYSLAGFLSVTSVVVNWFERYRSRALAMSQLGVTFGGLVLPAVAWSLGLAGWRTTALVSGAVILLAGVPLVWAMRGSPERYGLRLDGDAADAPTKPGETAAPARSRVEFTVAEALRTRAFWLVGFGHALALMMVSAVNVHAVVHITTALEYSLTTAASVIALMTVFAVVGQLLGGFLGDRYSKRLLAAVAMWLHAAAIGSLAFATGGATIVFFAVGHGVAWGVRAPLMQAIRADYFGRRAFAGIMGYAFLLAMLGTMTGPLVTGFFADVYGSYGLGFGTLAGLALLGSGVFLLAKEPRAPRR